MVHGNYPNSGSNCFNFERKRVRGERVSCERYKKGNLIWQIPFLSTVDVIVLGEMNVLRQTGLLAAYLR